MLYHLLPVVFWLLAIGGTVVPIILSLSTNSFHLSALYYWGYLVAALMLLCFAIIGRIQRHSNSIEECFQIAVLIGIASYWLPTVLLVILPIWAYLIYHNIFNFRSFLSTLMGLILVAIWAFVFIYLGWIDAPWLDFFAKENAWGWIPTGAIFLAWLASTIARRILRVR